MARPTNIYDNDGVVSIGVRPAIGDIIVTGRSFEEKEQVDQILKSMDVPEVEVFLNPATLAERGTDTVDASRCSGLHKAKTISELIKRPGFQLGFVFEDDPVQIETMLSEAPFLKDHIVHVKHPMTPGTDWSGHSVYDQLKRLR